MPEIHKIAFTKPEIYALAMWISDFLEPDDRKHTILFQKICERIAMWPLICLK